MKKYRNFILLIILAALLIVFILFSGTVVRSVKNSLLMCYNSIIPALFPFFILCGFLVRIISNMKVPVSILAFASSQVSGFPSGTKSVCELYGSKALDKKTASKMLLFTANASPAYLISFIGFSVIGINRIGLVLLLAQFTTSLVIALLSGALTQKSNSKINPYFDITDAACQSISSAVTSCLNICGYIIFFAIIADILEQLNFINWLSSILFFIPQNISKAVLLGSLEISKGATVLDFGQNYSLCLIAISVIIGFSGLSIIMQCVSFAVKYKLPARNIILGKLIYALLMPLFALLYNFVFKPDTIEINIIKSGALTSFIFFVVFILLAILIGYNIFDKSAKKGYNIKKYSGDVK